MARDAVIEAFTDLAPRYEGAMNRELSEMWSVSYEDFIRSLVEAIALKADEVVLDVATGTAQIPVALAGQRMAPSGLVGLDITPAMLRRGKENIATRGLNPRVKLVCASAMAMPMAERVFDVVVCGLGMHHMSVEDVLLQMRRVLREGGRIVLACVNAPAIWRSALGGLAIRVALLFYGWTQKSFRAQAEAAAVPNLRTIAEWQSILRNLGYHRIEIVAQIPPRRIWYPGGLILRAVKEGA